MPGTERTGGPKVRLFLVAGVRLYRDGLEQVLAQQPAVELLGTCADVPSMLDDDRSRPDVVLLDAGTSGALAAARSLRSVLPDVRIVALGLSETEHDVIEWAEAGMSGYVAQDGSVEELVATVGRAMRGEVVCPPTVTADLFAHLAARAGADAGEPRARLTSREAEIVDLIGQGLSNKEIARELSIALATVKNHVHNILDKLHVRDRREASRCLGPP